MDVSNEEIVTKIFRLIQIQSICILNPDLTQTLKSVFGRVEIIVGKGENTGYQHVLHSTVFSRAFFIKLFKNLDVWDYR